MIVLSLVFLFSNAISVEAAQNVQVKIPTFPVVLNDQSYDNQHAEYPLLVYKDITYFPMTYYLTRELGLSSEWDKEKGLYIVQHQEPDIIETDTMTANNKTNKLYQATIPTYPIVVNGWEVDNSKAEYPLLNFRGVTYFPLTWQYANDEFNWKIAWDSETGLYVNSNHLSSSYLAQITENYALFEEGIDVYETYQNDDDNTGYQYVRSDYKIYQLDFATDTLQTVANEKIETTWSPHVYTTCSDAFTIEEDGVYYQGHKMHDVTEQIM